MPVRRYTWKPDLPDIRDFYYRVPAKYRLPVDLPKIVDLREYFSPVDCQDDVGVCTGQAFASALEYLDNRADGKYVDLSRLFIYYNERYLAGTINQDAGAFLRDGIKALAKWGACEESLWPYKKKLFRCRPTDAAYRNGRKRRIKAYYRVDNLHGMKSALAEGYPVVFGMSIYSSFESPLVTQTGMVPMPEPHERFLGGHAMVAAGYNDDIARVIAKNSWEDTWGDAGYCHIPYEYIDNKNLADDFWAIRGDGLPLSDMQDHYDIINLGDDVKWYVPLINIVQFIKNIFGEKEKKNVGQD